jgi:hypothetical protein
VIHFVVGERFIDLWDATPGAVQVAYFEPRTDKEIREYRSLQREVEAMFRRHDRDELVRSLDWSVYLTSLASPPEESGLALRRMMGLGQPAAVFVAPPDAQPRS